MHQYKQGFFLTEIYDVDKTNVDRKQNYAYIDYMKTTVHEN